MIDVANIEIIGCSSAKNPANFIFTDGKHEYKYTSADSQLYMKFNNKEIVLDTWDRNELEGKMLCQIKHSITATEKNKIFQEVICAAWNDFNKEDFDRDCDRIALVTAQISNKAQQSLRFLHAEAIGSIDAEAFMEKIDMPVFSDDDNKKMLVAIKECISLVKGCEPENEELWKFCKVFILLLFDMDCAESVNRTLSASLIKYFIPVSGEYDNSLELRGNLVKSLCWVKKNLSELSQCNQEKIENNIYTLVSTLLQDAKWTTWTSLRDCLQNLAELSPEAFLKEAERGIINNPTEIVNLFPPKSGELSGINYISNLLWALEILAWSPEYLVHSISVLGLLEALPYERTNWTNTPINSIVSILLPWYPQTMADLEKRKNALKCLKTDNPRVFWSTLKKLLPNKTRSTSGNPRPKYLKLEIPKEVKVTNAEAHECYVYLVELAVDTARNENEKLVELIDQLGYMYEPTLTDYLECLENSFEFGADENTFEVWLKLRECMARIEPTEGKVIYKQLDRIQQLIEKMEPTDIRVKQREWYLGNRYLFDKGNYANRWEMLENKKLSAVKEIFDEYGSEEVERFGCAVKNVHDVANKLGRFLRPNEMSSIIEKCFIGIVSKEFMINCLISFVYTQGAEKLLETSLCQMEDDFTLEILSKIPFSLQLLDVINRVLDDDTVYWEKAAMPYGCYDAEVSL